MNLVSISREELPVGSPFPWMIYDQDGNILMEQGAQLDTEDEIESLLALGPMRDTDVDTLGLDADLEGSDSASFAFADMRLRVGDRLQLQPPANVATERVMVKLIGYVENVSLLTTSPSINGLRVPLRDNDRVVVRVFANQNAFGFDTNVMRVNKLPYEYLHLEFPTRIQGAVIRKSPRIRTKLITNITQPDPTGEFQVGNPDYRQAGLILNLSADGAQMQAKQVLAPKGGMLKVAFRVNLHDVDAVITVGAVVRSIIEHDPLTNDIKANTVMHGMQFTEVSSNDHLILQSMIYQKMIEQPHLLT
jgi:hypothetical protein